MHHHDHVQLDVYNGTGLEIRCMHHIQPSPKPSLTVISWLLSCILMVNSAPNDRIDVLCGVTYPMTCRYFYYPLQHHNPLHSISLFEERKSLGGKDSRWTNRYWWVCADKVFRPWPSFYRHFSSSLLLPTHAKSSATFPVYSSIYNSSLVFC
jgi:hypothetical protein